MTERESPYLSGNIVNDDTVFGFVAALNSIDYGLRYNDRKSQTEIRTGSPNWRPMNDREEANLRENLKARFYDFEGKRYNLSGEDIRHYCNVLAGKNTVDPFRIYLLNLPKWDGKPRTAELIEKLFPNSYGHLNAFVSTYIFLAAVYRTMKPGYKADIMPVFKGDQGIGKSTFIEYLTPLDCGFFKEGVSMNLPDQKLIESCLGAVHVEFGEIAGMRRSNIDKLKAFITRRNDQNVRLAYERRPDNLPRRCIFVGTTNAIKPLPNDVTGNRRFIVVDLLQSVGTTKIRNHLIKHRDQLWAEAVDFYRRGIPIYLNAGEERVQHEMNKSYRDGDEAVEESLRNTVWKRPSYTVTDVMLFSGLADNRSRTSDPTLYNRTLRAMIVLGWVQKGGRWLPPAE